MAKKLKFVRDSAGIRKFLLSNEVSNAVYKRALSVAPQDSQVVVTESRGPKGRAVIHIVYTKLDGKSPTARNRDRTAKTKLLQMSLNRIYAAGGKFRKGRGQKL